jgi:hypothetical protein
MQHRRSKSMITSVLLKGSSPLQQQLRQGRKSIGKSPVGPYLFLHEGKVSVAGCELLWQQQQQHMHTTFSIQVQASLAPDPWQSGEAAARTYRTSSPRRGCSLANYSCMRMTSDTVIGSNQCLHKFSIAHCIVSTSVVQYQGGGTDVHMTICSIPSSSAQLRFNLVMMGKTC